MACEFLKEPIAQRNDSGNRSLLQLDSDTLSFWRKRMTTPVGWSGTQKRSFGVSLRRLNVFTHTDNRKKPSSFPLVHTPPQIIYLFPPVSSFLPPHILPNMPFAPTLPAIEFPCTPTTAHSSVGAADGAPRRNFGVGIRRGGCGF